MPLGYIYFIMFFLMVTMGLANLPIFGDPDTAWHIAAGDLIRITHQIPRLDGWSFTAINEPWYDLSWAFDCGISLCSFSAIYALTVTVFVASLGAMAWHCGRKGASPLAVLLATLLAAFVVSTGMLARPNMVSLMLVVVFYQFLCSYRDGGNNRKLVILVPLMCLWANMHGGFLVAFVLIGVFLLEALIKKNEKQRTTYLGLIALCLVASTLNPYGLAAYYGAYRSLASSFSATLIEWQPVAIGHNVQMTLLLVCTLLAGDFFDKKIVLSDRLLAFLFLFLSLSSFRYASIAALLMMPYLSLRFSALMAKSKWATRIRKFEKQLMADMEKKETRVVALVMVGLALLVLYLPSPRDEILKEPARFSENHFPIEEASFISQHYPNKRFFNSYNIGGYLDYIWRGQTKVFVDGRASSLYSEGLLSDANYISDTHGFGARAKMLLKYYKIDGLIIAHDDKDASLWNVNPDWKKVYSGKAASVFLPK